MAWSGRETDNKDGGWLIGRNLKRQCEVAMTWMESDS